MSGGINSPSFKLKRRRAQQKELRKRKKIARQLKELNVKIDCQDSMSLKDLQALVNCHRVTIDRKIEDEKRYARRVLRERMGNPAPPKIKKVKETKAQRRARRQAEMARMLDKLNAEEQAK